MEFTNIAAIADLEAAARYRALADRNPTLRRDYNKRAELAEAIGNAKLAKEHSSNA